MGRRYTIEFHPKNSLQDENGDPIWGDTNHDEQLIRIEDGLPHDKERAIVLHEWYHQILSLLNVTLPAEQEEHLCTVLGEAHIGHIRDNPKFWRYIMRREKKSP